MGNQYFLKVINRNLLDLIIASQKIIDFTMVYYLRIHHINNSLPIKEVLMQNLLNKKNIACLKKGFLIQHTEIIL